jgi:hypothetical protein
MAPRSVEGSDPPYCAAIASVPSHTVDLNLSPRWIERLKDSGFEAEHWSTVGDLKASDSEIMEYAATHGYVVLTHEQRSFDLESGICWKY